MESKEGDIHRRKIRPKGSTLTGAAPILRSSGKKKTTPILSPVHNKNIPTTTSTTLPPSENSGGITVVWTIVSNSEAIKRLLRTLYYIQEAAVQITQGVSLVSR